MTRYSEYKELHNEVNEAVECPKGSELKDKIDQISKALSSMNLEWNDSVKANFDSFITSCAEFLGKISTNIDTNFTSAEDAYKSLKDLLDKFEKDDKAYTELCNNVPEQWEVIGTYENGVQKKGETKAYKDWKINKTTYEQNFDSYVAGIEPLKRVLMNVNTQKIKGDLDNADIQTNAPIFEMPENITKSGDNSAIFTSDGSREGNAFDVWKFFASKVDSNGNRILSDAAIAGILGNMSRENTNFDPGVYEGNSQKNPREKGYGIIQWTNYKGMQGGRRDQLFQAAEQSGVSADNLQFQCEYLWDEVFTARSEAKYNHSGNPDYFNNLANSGFYNTSDPVEAARLFHNIVEGSADSYSAVLHNRGGDAQEWYSKFSDDVGVSV